MRGSRSAGLTVVALRKADRSIPIQGGGSIPGWSSVMLFGLFAVGVLVAFIWHALGREEWEVGENRLDVHRALLDRSWTRRYREATLRISYRLQAAGPAAHEVWSLWLKTPGQRRMRLLFTGAWGPAEVRTLGELLSRTTGWPLQLPDGSVVPAGPQDG